ncbi:MAG: hypothetical protein ABMA64_16795 [Myxococcota bacterium]
MWCDAYGAPEIVASLDVAIEASGLAPSSRAGVWFTHGDNGDPAVVYAFDADGLEAEHPVDAPATDWEDLAAAPCPDRGDCLYIGDIGDNDASRDTISVVVVRAPGRSGAAERVEIRSARYPDGPHDAEALLVNPCTGEVQVVTKGESASVYRWPAGADTLTFAATLDLSEPVTGGAWDPDAHRVALRSDHLVWVWNVDPAAPTAHWSTAPVVIAGVSEAGGEGVTFTADGGVATLGDEQLPDVVVYPCAEPADAPEVCTRSGCGCGGNPGGHGGWLALAALVAARLRASR